MKSELMKPAPPSPTLTGQLAMEKTVNCSKYKFSAMVSIREAAKILGVSYSTLHRLIQRGLIQQIQISPGRKVIPIDAIESYINQCYQQAA